MSERDALLRLLVNGDKEFKTTTLNVTQTPTLFTSQLSDDYARKLVTFYNNSDATSGEIRIGHSGEIGLSGNSGEKGYPLPIGAEITIPVFRKLNKDTGAEETLDIYLICTSGEADIRVMEVA